MVPGEFCAFQSYANIVVAVTPDAPAIVSFHYYYYYHHHLCGLFVVPFSCTIRGFTRKVFKVGIVSDSYQCAAQPGI